MPQGTVIAVKPSLTSHATSDYDWVESLRSFIQDNTGQELDIGVIEICDTEGDSELTADEKMLFIIPKGEFPSGIENGSCKEPNATKVKFLYKKHPFKYIDKIISKEDKE